MSHVVLPCPACKNLNRVPTERLGDVPVCATCRTRLLGQTIELGDADFDKVVRSSDLPVVVDFWAGWCGPCRMMAPHFAATAQQLAGRFVFAKVDTEAAPRTAQRFAIQSIPTLVVLRRGVEEKRISGALQQPQLVQWLGA